MDGRRAKDIAWQALGCVRNQRPHVLCSDDVSQRYVCKVFNKKVLWNLNVDLTVLDMFSTVSKLIGDIRSLIWHSVNIDFERTNLCYSYCNHCMSLPASSVSLTLLFTSGSLKHS